MQNRKLSIRKIVNYLNDDEAEGGGLWLPNIQRPFVWSEEQIERLFDSIMREYPISTLLVWKTKASVKHRKFIDSYKRDIKLTDFYVADNSRPKMMVLDGQQRLQSLFIGLKGMYETKQLFLDILSGGIATAPEDIRFRFAFKAGKPGWPWVLFKDIVLVSNKLDSEIVKAIVSTAPADLAPAERDSVERNVGRARKEFVTEDNITFQELDGIDNPGAYEPDDIVEIFIRANSGGTKLGKSDLLFSLLISSWDEADGEMEALLEDLNAGGFEFDRDFVLKACLTMLGKGARYEVEKLRDGNTKEEIINRWDELADAIRAIRDLLVSGTYIRTDKAMPSYLALIPAIYFRFHFPKKFSDREADIATFLLRALVAGVFSGGPDNVIDKLVRNIHEQKDFVLKEIYGVVRAEGRSLEVTPAVIFNQYYGSREIHLFFNLWYQAFNYTPALDANGPQVDHIFPQSLLKQIKDINPDTGKRNLLRYRSEQRDQIANCMLLTAAENCASGKRDQAPAQWFALSRFKSKEDQQKYLDLHLIPQDPSLWEVDRFEDFVTARKELIRDKFAFMLL